MTARTIVIVLFLLWLAVFAGSILMAQAVEGPRNIDTGFRRLETLMLWQGVAFVVAVVATGVTLSRRGLTRSTKLIGYAPVGLTVLLVVAGIIAVKFVDMQGESTPYSAPAKPTTMPVAVPAAEPLPD